MSATRRALLRAAGAAAAFGVTSFGSRAFAQHARTQIVAFENSPFPYDGVIPDKGVPFYDTLRDGRRGHTSPRGGVYTEATYADRRSLLHLSAHGGARGALVVYLHGNKATLAGEVVARQRVTSQFDAARIGGALVAPQLALNALDSSAGRFWEPDFFARYLAEAAQRLGAISGAGANVFDRLPVILVAYSGGYNPAAFALQVGGAGSRVRGVILLDALFGELPRFADWATQNHDSAFFVNAYGPASRNESQALRRLLSSRGVAAIEGVPTRLAGGGVWFIDSGSAAHIDFVQRAWVANPLAALLSRVG